MTKRLIISISTGAILGIFCIIGVSFRLGFFGNELFIAATYFNRLVMGLVIGLASPIILIKGRWNFLVRGLFLGFFISFAWFIDTGFRDPMGFAAGLVYGIIIDYIASRYS
jgi:hypothetical protein